MERRRASASRRHVSQLSAQPRRANGGDDQVRFSAFGSEDRDRRAARRRPWRQPQGAADAVGGAQHRRRRKRAAALDQGQKDGRHRVRLRSLGLDGG